MRLHCPVPFIARNNTTPLEIEGHTVPPGTFMVANIWCLHHNPTVWGPDHMQFKPERFAKENISKLDSFAFLPFSAGPRYLYTNKIQSFIISLFRIHINFHSCFLGTALGNILL